MNKKSIPVTNDFCPQTLFLYGTYKEDGTPDFGLFCWFSYCWNGELGVMACIGGKKNTKDRIQAAKVFSANLVTETMLNVADYYGTTDGYNPDKMKVASDNEKGQVLNVPTLKNSPLVFELEVVKEIPLDDSDIFICKIRNVLAAEELLDDSKTIEERIQSIAPVKTTCETYFSFTGKAMGKWGELKNNL
jgi:flavin reductase (DIM6/NTAB) family NADH-FMN oxidoreductase RutF